MSLDVVRRDFQAHGVSFGRSENGTSGSLHCVTGHRPRPTLCSRPRAARLAWTVRSTFVLTPIPGGTGRTHSLDGRPMLSDLDRLMSDRSIDAVIVPMHE